MPRSGGSRFETLRQQEWISLDTAARMTGRGRDRIVLAVRAGLIEQRPVQFQGQPSLRRESVEAWATRCKAEDAAASRAARRRDAARAAARAAARPPDDGHVWLDQQTVAIMLGISRVRVGQLVRTERIPSIRTGRRLWFRRDLIEQYAAARAARKGSMGAQNGSLGYHPNRDDSA